MPAYCSRDDVEDLFGINNVVKWADLDNDAPELEGSLTIRTDADTGIVTLDSDHGIQTVDTVDVYWRAGHTYGMDVTASASTTIGIDGGEGDDLPAQDTTVYVRIADKIAARIARAITAAIADVDSRMLGGIYTVPITLVAGGIPEEIKQITATLAGVWLYERRGVEDYDAENETSKHRLSFNKDEALLKLDQYRAGTRRFAGTTSGTSKPYVHDHYTQIADDSDLTSEVRQGET